MTGKLIPPHGGHLINLFSPVSDRSLLLSQSADLPHLPLDERNLADLECLATGLYSPLTGFINEDDYLSVLQNMRLSNGLPWPIPVSLMVDQSFSSSLNLGDKIILTWNDQPLAILMIESIFSPDKKEEALKVYLTADSSHPFVDYLFNSGPVYLGGSVKVFSDFPHSNFSEYRLSPSQTRESFTKKGWSTVVAFQTRNPIHRAHEYLQKVALEQVDGLFINPLVGHTKKGDIPSDVRMHTYEVILSKYFPKDRTFLSVFPAAMRYGGPREAIMHALSRKNFGCSHFIVGRDHAGVGDFYGTYDAQNIFDEFDLSELGIQILKFEHAFFCTKCGQMASNKTCPHEPQDRVFLSGTKVREMLSQGQLPPSEFTRPEVAKILMDFYSSNIDQ